MWRLIYFIPSWILFLLLRTIAILLGWILIPMAAIAGAYEKSYDQEKADKGENPIVYHFTWKLMYPWDNNEDGIANDMYYKAPSTILQIIYWSAIRNPANNLRYIPGLSVNIKKGEVHYIGSLGSSSKTLVDPRIYDRDDLLFWYVAWQGVYSNYRIHFKMFNKHWRFWIGWKIYPEDRIFTVTGHRTKGAGFATQFKRIWPK